ncbi:MAG: spore coat protein CotJB [Acutalibacteraceae bacterium]
MNEREMMMRRIATLDFAIVELNLYMDTHPNDTEVNAKLNDYKKKSDELKKEYQDKYGPITSKTIEDNRYGWIADPWPWNNSESGEE